jgi:hypothetical protein
MSRLLVYRNRVGAPVGSLQTGTVFESGSCFYIKIDTVTTLRRLAAVEGELGQPVINLSSFELEFMDEDERVMPAETAKLNVT